MLISLLLLTSFWLALIGLKREKGSKPIQSTLQGIDSKIRVLSVRLEELSNKIEGLQAGLLENGWKEGKATYYHDKFEGRVMANGQVFKQDSNFVACNHLGLGTKILIYRNGSYVIGQVTDRGELFGRDLDLSSGLFAQLAPLELGVIKVRYIVLP